LSRLFQQAYWSDRFSKNERVPPRLNEEKELRDESRQDSSHLPVAFIVGSGIQKAMADEMDMAHAAFVRISNAGND
jgi:hypothetical protein